MKERLKEIKDRAPKLKDIKKSAINTGLAMALVGSMGLAGCQQSAEQRAAEVAAAVQTVLAQDTPTPDAISALSTQVAHLATEVAGQRVGLPPVATVQAGETPRPEERATRPSAPTELTIPNGQRREVSAGWTCSGDVVIDGERLYDDRAESGVVVYTGDQVEVEAPWGAHCVQGDAREEKRQDLLKSGCGLPNGCEAVDVVVRP